MLDEDMTSKNVGGLSVGNAEPVSFNHLTGHFAEALISTAAGGSDQTASWGGTPVVRPAVMTIANAGFTADGDDDDDTSSDYQTLNGMNDTGDGGGRLADKNAGGMGTTIENTVAGYETLGDNEILDRTSMNRGITGGALVLPALHGGGEFTQQIMLILSAADDFGGAGKYMLIAAKTGLMVSLMDGMGDALPNPAAESGPTFGGATAPDAPPGTKIIVYGMQVMTDAGDCDGDMVMGPWMLDHLTDIVPSAMSGADDFDGLDAMMDPMMSASPGWIKFMRADLTCKMDYGDTTPAGDSTTEGSDGVPIDDERTTRRTLIVRRKTRCVLSSPRDEPC